MRLDTDRPLGLNRHLVDPLLLGGIFCRARTIARLFV